MISYTATPLYQIFSMIIMGHSLNLRQQLYKNEEKFI